MSLIQQTMKATEQIGEMIKAESQGDKSGTKLQRTGKTNNAIWFGPNIYWRRQQTTERRLDQVPEFKGQHYHWPCGMNNLHKVA